MLEVSAIISKRPLAQPSSSLGHECRIRTKRCSLEHRENRGNILLSGTDKNRIKANKYYYIFFVDNHCHGQCSGNGFLPKMDDLLNNLMPTVMQLLQLHPHLKLHPPERADRSVQT